MIEISARGFFLWIFKPVWYPFYLIFNYLVHPVWSYVCPVSSYHKQRRKQKLRKVEAIRLDDEFEQLRLKNHGRIQVVNTDTYPPGPFFTRIPSDIRRQILIAAFGGQTVHLDLEVVEKKDSRDIRSWQWVSCVCHSERPDLPHESHDRAHSHNRTKRRDPLACPGSQRVRSHSGECPGACLVGASGWILSCRRAYQEGLEVLYSTNTIHISSLALLRAMHEFLAPEKMALMRSLVLNFEPDLLIFDEILGGSPPKITANPFRFSFLVQLRLVCGLKADLVHLIDRLVRRVVSSRTEVIVYCNSWEAYTNADLKLAEEQGLETTRMKWADIGGLQCWREMSPKESIGSCGPTGYWIHVSDQLIPSRDGNFLCDDRRIDHYSLTSQGLGFKVESINGTEGYESEGYM